MTEALARREPDTIVPKLRDKRPVKALLQLWVQEGKKVKDIISMDPESLTIEELIVHRLVNDVVKSEPGSNQSIKAVASLKTSIDGKEAMEEFQEAIRESRVILMGQVSGNERREESITVRNRVQLTGQTKIEEIV